MFSFICCCCQAREPLINDSDAPKLIIDGYGADPDFSLKTPAATAVHSEDENEEEDERSRSWSFRKSLACDNVDELLQKLGEEPGRRKTSSIQLEGEDAPFIEVSANAPAKDASPEQGTAAPLLKKEEVSSEPAENCSSETTAETPERVVRRASLKDGLKAVSDRGRELFQKMAKSLKQEEIADAEIAKAPQVERLRISIQTLQIGKWRVFGIHEDVMVKIGLEELDKYFKEDGLMDFPRRPNGSSKLLRETFFKGVLTGTRDLKSTHHGDVSAAQGDIKQLSFRQLLKMRALYLDYDPTRHESTKVQAAFLQSLDQNLFLHLPKEAIGEEAASLFDVHSLRKFGFDLTLLTAAHHALPTGRHGPPPWWACHLEGQLVYFNASEFSVQANFPDCGVLQIQDLSKPDGQRRKIDWNVIHVSVEEDLSQVSSAELEVTSFTSYGAQGSSFTVSRETLMTQLGSLKKVGDRS